jgi:hypothetical protein
VEIIIRRIKGEFKCLEELVDDTKVLNVFVKFGLAKFAQVRNMFEL